MTALLDNDPELLCYCEQVSQVRFAHLAAERPDESFAELCERTGVGMACTSCLINAEVAFATARTTMRPHSDALTAPAESRQRMRLPDKAALVERLLALAPSVPAAQSSVCPIVVGNGLGTTLSVSNAYPAPIGPESAPYRLTIEVRDAAGALRNRSRHDIAPGERCDVRVSDWLEAIPGTLVIGTARLILRALEKKYRGTVRPHFSITAAHSSAAVHTANAASHHTSLHLVSRCGDDRNYVHVFNAENRPGFVRVRLGNLAGDTLETKECRLPAFGSAMLPLGNPAAACNTDELPVFTVQVEADTIQRSWFIVTDRDSSRVSVDHI